MIFQGTIRLPDDPARLQATMRVTDGRLIIESEGQLISEWGVDRIEMTHRQDGIVLLVDGESIIVTPTDRYGFSDTVDAAKETKPKRRSLLRRRKKSNQAPKAPAPSPPAAPSPPPTSTGAPSSTERPQSGFQPLPAQSNDDGSPPVVAGSPAQAAWRPTPAIDVPPPGDTASARGPVATRRPLPPVEPPDPASWRAVDGRSPTKDADRRTETPPDDRAPVEPNGADDADNSLSDAVQSARAEPLLAGFRKAEPQAPLDVTKEIFGDPAEELPKKRGIGGRLADRWLDVSLARRRATLGIAILVLLALIAPALVASLLVLAGLVACLVGGAGMADPSYTRKLPPELSEVRLLVSGGIMLVAGFLVGLPSV